MYPLPPELSDKILNILYGYNVRAGDIADLHDQFAALLVRENRKARQQIADLWRSLSETASRDDGEYGDIRAAAGGEFTCEYIINSVLKPSVNENAGNEIVDRIIEEFYEEDDGSGV